jgi:class 3 adenylate cyclase
VVVNATVKKATRGVSLGTRIFGLPLVILALLVGITYFSLYRLSLVKNELDHVASYWLPAVELVNEIDREGLKQQVRFERVLKLYEIQPLPSDQISREMQAWTEGGERIDTLLARAKHLIDEDAHLSGDSRTHLTRLDSALVDIGVVYRAFSTEARETMALFGENDREEAHRLEAKLDEAEARFERAIEAMQHVVEHSFEQAILHAEEHERRVLHVNLILTIVGAIFGVVLAVLVTARLTAPVRRLMVSMRSVQRGDLDVSLEATSNDEIGALTRSFNEMVDELKLKDTIEQTFGKYVDARVVKHLLEEPGGPKTGGENQVMTVLFGNVEGLENAMRLLSPEILVDLTNQYLTQLSEPVVRHGGVIDKYIDDMVMAFWGKPFTDEEAHAHLACAGALDQLAQLDQVRRLVAEAAPGEATDLILQVGLATGPLVVGSMGSEQARSYTVMGDTVNTASRLKGANKEYGTQILLTEETQQLAGPTMETREIDLIGVVGKDESVRIYELLGSKEQLDSATTELREVFHQGLAAYREQDWDRAMGHFEHCLRIRTEDGPALVYLERLRILRDNPPDDAWDGVWRLTRK